MGPERLAPAQAERLSLVQRLSAGRTKAHPLDSRKWKTFIVVVRLPRGNM